jgi:hypothetical protein
LVIAVTVWMSRDVALEHEIVAAADHRPQMERAVVEGGRIVAHVHMPELIAQPRKGDPSRRLEPPRH